MTGFVRKSDAYMLLCLNEAGGPLTIHVVNSRIRKVSERPGISTRYSLDHLVNIGLCRAKVLISRKTNYRYQTLYSLTANGKKFAEAYIAAKEYIDKIGTSTQVRFFINVYATYGDQPFRVIEAFRAGNTLKNPSAATRALQHLAKEALVEKVRQGLYVFKEEAFEAYLLLSATALEPFTVEVTPPVVRTARALLSAEKPMSLGDIATVAQLAEDSVRVCVGTKLLKGSIRQNSVKEYSIIRDSMSPELVALLEQYS